MGRAVLEGGGVKAELAALNVYTGGSRRHRGWPTAAQRTRLQYIGAIRAAARVVLVDGDAVALPSASNPRRLGQHVYRRRRMISRVHVALQHTDTGSRSEPSVPSLLPSKKNARNIRC